MVIKVSDKPKKAVKEAEVSNETGGTGNKMKDFPFFAPYWYRQLDKLWDAMHELQEENIKLRASKSGGP